MKRHHFILIIIALCSCVTTFAQGIGMSAYKMNKMSSYIRELYMTNYTSAQHGGLASRAGSEQPVLITAFIKTTSAQSIEQCGGHILRSFGDIHIVEMPTTRIADMAGMPEVTRIEASRPDDVTIDKARALSHVDNVWRFANLHPALSQTGYTGKGIVVGTMDIGYDLLHPTLFSADGSEYRVKRFWDMLDYSTDGEPVEGEDTVFVGRQYTSVPEIISKAHSSDAHLSGHGTQTTSISAGSGRNVDGTMSSYTGMAPDAELCLISNYTTTSKPVVPEKDQYKYGSALNAIGFGYIFDYAETQNKPCVISFSEGARPSFSDDNKLYAEALRMMQGPGRIIVSSAGNESEHASFLYKPLGKAKGGTFLRSTSKNSYSLTQTNDKMTTRITLYPPSAEPIVSEAYTDEILACKDEILGDTILINGKEYIILFNAYPSEEDNTKWRTEVLVTVPEGDKAGGAIPISLTIMGENIISETYSIIGYMENNSLDPSLADAEKSHNILTPGAFEGVICVGNVTTDATHPVIDSNSSIGPTIEGRIKPDVTAGGTKLMCAKSKKYYGAYGWISASGTSMSTPVVAGTIALWLEAFPTLTPQQAMEVIAKTSRHPDESLDYPNNIYGYGIIDAEAGLEYILNNFTGVAPIKQVNRHINKYLYNFYGQRIYTPTKKQPLKVINH